MSYTPTNWQTGDTITAEKLNKLENGVAGGGGGDFLQVNFEFYYDGDQRIVTCNKTVAELNTAFATNTPMSVKCLFFETYPMIESTEFVFEGGAYRANFNWVDPDNNVLMYCTIAYGGENTGWDAPNMHAYTLTEATP